MVLYGSFMVTETMVSNAKITISISFASPVSDFFGNAKILLQVFYSTFKIAESRMNNANITIFSCLNPKSRGRAENERKEERKGQKNKAYSQRKTEYESASEELGCRRCGCGHTNVVNYS